MPARSSLVTQISPSDASPNLAHEANLNIEFTKIIVCNTSNAASSFSIFHDNSGNNVFDATTALYFNSPINVGETRIVEAASDDSGITLKKGGQIAVQTSAPNSLTFSLYGVPQDTQGLSALPGGR